ncbi:sensor histidine kinase [Evansella tamaricis]|uniref:Sensor histidine kinase n=1 Tax=Evansella tamaricis TaxID=2069301 RepID=A0ABS6JKW3_9BACI|nr:sensor histidine kinase [Evansella tamaricis]MBU9714319.1 sensor histidine kinase [Evansella tamaricis]
MLKRNSKQRLLTPFFSFLNRTKKWNTLRNQIFIVFITVMVIVLLIVGVNTYNVVSAVLKSNAEKQIQQTAIQASGKMEALYEQVDTLTLQVATHSHVQDTLLKEVLGDSVSFSQRQSLMGVVNSHLAYYNGIDSLELYSVDGKRMYPLHEGQLSNRLEEVWIDRTDEQRGRLVWVGQDPSDPSYFIAIRQVTLLDRWFSPGGYLLVRIRDSYFQFEDTNNEEGEYMVLYDHSQTPIFSNFDGDIIQILQDHNRTGHLSINRQEYMMVEHFSKLTQWKTIILTPIDLVTRNVSVLRSAIIVSGILGFFIFLLFSLFLSTVITRPILKLTKTMRFGRLGALKAHQETSATYEINELNETYNQMVETMNNLIEEVYEKEITRSRSELKALQAQINPHFLYNTLDALYWSLDAKGEDTLAEYVLHMSQLFRYTISNPKEDDWVTLKEEIDHIERYMKIMQVRFGKRLTWRLDVPETYHHMKIPKLLIQPLVENAILHGVGNKSGEGTVELLVRPATEKSRVMIEIKDDGAGMGEEIVQKISSSLENKNTGYFKGKGMAIVNCNKRLQLYFCEDQIREIAFESEEGRGTTVSFEIPFNGVRE